MWTTLDATPHPVVYYGTDMENLNFTQNGTSSTYTQAGWKGNVSGETNGPASGELRSETKRRGVANLNPTSPQSCTRPS